MIVLVIGSDCDDDDDRYGDCAYYGTAAAAATVAIIATAITVTAAAAVTIATVVATAIALHPTCELVTVRPPLYRGFHSRSQLNGLVTPRLPSLGVL